MTEASRDIESPLVGAGPAVKPCQQRSGSLRVTMGFRPLDPTMPGPAGSARNRRAAGLDQRPVRDVRGHATKYGDVFRVPLPTVNLVVVNHPDLVDLVMSDRDGLFSMIRPFGSGFARVFEETLPGMQRERFRQRRRTLTPRFGRRHLAEIAEAIVDEFGADSPRRRH